MLGPASKRAAVVWVKASPGDTVQVRLKDGRSFSREADGDGIAHVHVEGLMPDTSYAYTLVVKGRTQGSFELRTKPDWEHRAPAPDFHVALGSCAFVSEKPFDRPGRPYGEHYEVFESIADAKPDLMLWLGDNIYLRPADWDSRFGFFARYEHTRSIPEMARLLATTRHYATWDDHDYGPNNSDRTYPLKEVSLEAFKAHWPNPSFGNRQAPGIFTKFRWGDAEFFILDDRFHRTPITLADDPGAQMFGPVQLRWLLEGLRSSNARFKIVAAGSQMLPPQHPREAFSAYTREYQRFVRALSEAEVPGLLLLSGDRHHTELTKLATEKGPLYEWTVSPLTSKAAPRAEAAKEDVGARVPESLITKRGFGLLSFLGEGASRFIRLRYHDSEGKELWEHTLSAKELGY